MFMRVHRVLFNFWHGNFILAKIRFRVRYIMHLRRRPYIHDYEIDNLQGKFLQGPSLASFKAAVHITWLLNISWRE